MKGSHHAQGVPPESRRDVVVARKGESSLHQIAKDFGISESRDQGRARHATRWSQFGTPSFSGAEMY